MVASIALFGVASFLGIRSMWGLNHLSFLSPPWWLGFWFITGLVISLVTLRRPAVKLLDWADWLGAFIFSYRLWPGLLLALAGGAVFYFVTMPTHFLGDGYPLLSVFGQGEARIEKWTETGSITVVTWIQSFFGEHTTASARRTFQVLSVCSGVIVIFNLLGIAARLAERNWLRLWFFCILTLSGMLLLFFGYVELYPLVWASVTTFIHLALRYLDTGKGLLLVLLSFAVSVYLHLISLCFAIGVLYLIFARLPQAAQLLAKRRVLFVSIVLGALFGLLAIELIARRLWTVPILLPLIIGPPEARNYAVLSPKHLLDVVNQMLVMYPGWIALVILSFGGKLSNGSYPKRVFLGAMALGGILFLLLVDPGLGLARDWDLMSLGVFAVMLYLLVRVEACDVSPNRAVVVAVVLFSLLATPAYLVANVSAPAAEQRFLSILEYYGSRERCGWSAAADYFRDKGDVKGFGMVLERMTPFFPEEAMLAGAYACMDRRDYSGALVRAEKLVQQEPGNPRYLQTLGKVYGKLGEYGRAEACYLAAVKIKPKSVMLRNEFGQLYLQGGRYDDALRELKYVRRMDPTLSFVAEGVALTYFRMGFLESAAAIADTLFAANIHSPGGHLIRMIIAIQKGDHQTAAQHLAAFRCYGVGRSDYTGILEFYAYLES